MTGRPTSRPTRPTTPSWPRPMPSSSPRRRRTPSATARSRVRVKRAGDRARCCTSGVSGELFVALGQRDPRGARRRHHVRRRAVRRHDRLHPDRRRVRDRRATSRTRACSCAGEGERLVDALVELAAAQPREPPARSQVRPTRRCPSPPRPPRRPSMTDPDPRHLPRAGHRPARPDRAPRRASRSSRAGAAVADRIAEDRLIYVIGPGGHSQIGAEEVFSRAGGLACIVVVHRRRLLPRPRRRPVDARSSGRRATPGRSSTRSGMASRRRADHRQRLRHQLRHDRQRDVRPRARHDDIGVTSIANQRGLPQGHPSRHPSGKDLCDLVDIVVDTKMPLGDAVHGGRRREREGRARSRRWSTPTR